MWSVVEKFYLDPMFGSALNEYRAELNLPPVRHVISQWWHSPDRVIGLFPAWFAAPQPDWPKQTVVTDFPRFDEADVTPLSAEILRFLDAGSPPIAFAPGSTNMHGRKFFAAGAEACRRLGRRGILLTRHPEQISQKLPDGVIHTEYAPFSQLLPRCAALVHHGGIGTTAQGLAAGVPQLIMPMGYDQPDNAQRVKNLGVGDWLWPWRFSAGSVARKLDRLLSSTGPACRAVAGNFKKDGDPLEKTVECIEALLVSPC